MSTLADYIADYIKSCLERSPDGRIEIQRSHLANKFGCAPSQVTYVLATRFDIYTGFLVESKRGGGGFIRVIRLNLPKDKLLQELCRYIGSSIGYREARAIILRLSREELITEKEVRLIMSAIDNRVFAAVDLPARDKLRAQILKSIIGALFVDKCLKKED